MQAIMRRARAAGVDVAVGHEDSEGAPSEWYGEPEGQSMIKAVIMRDPESNWSDALDANYYDQAHFNRDFRQFFKMSPREYRAHPHPIIGAASKARMAAMGDPLQALQKPGAGNGH